MRVAAMNRGFHGSIALTGQMTVGVSAFAALAADIEALVEQVADECQQGVVREQTADQLSAIVSRAERLLTSA
jgi:hypothetical protein